MHILKPCARAYIYKYRYRVDLTYIYIHIYLHISSTPSTSLPYGTILAFGAPFQVCGSGARNLALFNLH